MGVPWDSNFSLLGVWASPSHLAQSGVATIIDPKTQAEALLAKLLVWGLAPGGEPWKELIRHQLPVHVDQTKLPVHGKGPDTPNINWIFAAPKLKRTPCSMWKSILGAWINVRPGLTKEDPTSKAEFLRQPLFGNPSFTNTRGLPLRVKDLWN